VRTSSKFQNFNPSFYSVIWPCIVRVASQSIILVVIESFTHTRVSNIQAKLNTINSISLRSNNQINRRNSRLYKKIIIKLQIKRKRIWPLIFHKRTPQLTFQQFKVLYQIIKTCHLQYNQVINNRNQMLKYPLQTNPKRNQ
jgi:hypothetical protein